MRTIETDIRVVNPEDLTWNDLRTYAKAKGINTLHLTKSEILKRLKK